MEVSFVQTFLLQLLLHLLHVAMAAFVPIHLGPDSYPYCNSDRSAPCLEPPFDLHRNLTLKPWEAASLTVSLEAPHDDPFTCTEMLVYFFNMEAVMVPKVEISVRLPFGNQTSSRLVKLDDSRRSDSATICGGGGDTAHRNATIVAVADAEANITLQFRPKSIRLQVNKEELVTIDPHHSVTFLLDPSGSSPASDYFHFKVENLDAPDSNVCLIVSVFQNKRFTVLQRGSLTISSTTSQYEEPMYITLIVPSDDKACRLPGDLVMNAEKRTKRVSIKVTEGELNFEAIHRYAYTTFALVFLACFYFAWSLKRQQSVEADCAAAPSNMEEAKGIPMQQQRRVISATILDDIIAWLCRPQTAVGYCSHARLLTGFYVIPAFQLVFQVKETERLTGSQDLCFHNFSCARPFFIFSDFNHVISNVSYLISGLAYMLMVWLKARNCAGSDPMSKRWSVNYAMGFSLFSQGIFSAAYHVCPTNQSLLIDTTMMYSMCLHSIAKIYQLRHPKAAIDPNRLFFLLFAVVVLEALALYWDSWWVYGPFLMLYLHTTVTVARDCYLNEVDKLVVGNEGRHWVANILRKCGIRFPVRLGVVLMFCLLNFLIAGYVAHTKWSSPRKSLSKVLLLILLGNLALYATYFVVLCRQKRSNSDHATTTEIFAFLFVLFGSLAIVCYVDRDANRNLSAAESRKLNRECKYFDFFDRHDMWHLLSAGAILSAFLAFLAIEDDEENEAVVSEIDCF